MTKTPTVHPPLSCPESTLCFVVRLIRKEWIVFILLFDDCHRHLCDVDDDDDELHGMGLSDPVLVHLFFAGCVFTSNNVKWFCKRLGLPFGSIASVHGWVRM